MTTYCSLGLSQSSLAWLWFLLSLCISLTNDVIVKHLGTGISGLEVSFFRFFFASVVLIATCFSQIRSTPSVHHRTHFLRSVFLAAGMCIWNISLPHVHLAQATMINLTIPLMNLMMGRLILKENISTSQYVATFLGFFGVLMTIQGHWMEYGSFHWAEIALLCGAWCFAGVDLLNKVSGTGEPFVSTLFWTAFYTCLLCGFLTFSSFTIPTASQLSLLFILGVNANALFYCLLQALAVLNLSDLAPMRYVEVLLSMSIGWLLFSEYPSLKTLLGGLCIAFAAIQAVRSEHQKREAH